MKNLSTLLVIIVCLINYSCDKDEGFEVDYTIGQISIKLYPYLFEKNSYWVYSSSDNLTTDSVYVHNIELDTLIHYPSTPGEGPAGGEQFHEITYISSVYGTHSEQLVNDVISRGNVYGGYVYLTSQTIGYEHLNAKISDIYSSLIINGINYRNVVKMEVEKDNYLAQSMNIYYADSIGVIKRELIENNNISETWNLLRFNVNLLESF